MCLHFVPVGDVALGRFQEEGCNWTKVPVEVPFMVRMCAKQYSTLPNSLDATPQST